MALTKEQWDAIQERACNPFRSNESNAVNRLTKALTLGNDVVLQEHKQEHIDYKTVRVLATSYIKDNAYIEISSDVDLDFTDDDNYLSNTDRGMDVAGTYYIALHYVYSESIPYPVAEIKILKHAAELTDAVLLICNVNVEYSSANSRMEIVSIDFENVPYLKVEMLRTGDTVNIGFERLSGLAIEESNPKSNTVSFNGGKIIDKDEQKVRFLNSNPAVGPFDPVSSTSVKRLDLLTVKMDGTINHIVGTEVPIATSLSDSMCVIPYDEFPLAYVTVTETSNVIISSSDIIDVRDFVNTPQDLRDEIVSLMNLCASTINKYDALKTRVEILEAKVG